MAVGRKLVIVQVDDVPLPAFKFLKEGNVVAFGKAFNELERAGFRIGDHQLYRRRSPGKEDRREENVFIMLQPSRMYGILCRIENQTFWVGSPLTVCFFKRASRVADHHLPPFPVNHRACYILHLPEELQLKIMDWVDGEDLARMSCVCSKFRDLVNAGGEELWEERFKEEREWWTKEWAVEMDGDRDWKGKFAEAVRIENTGKELTAGFGLPSGFPEIIHQIMKDKYDQMFMAAQSKKSRGYKTDTGRSLK